MELFHVLLKKSQQQHKHFSLPKRC